MGPWSRSDSDAIQASKVATSVVFVLGGWVFATWAGRVPDVRDLLLLTPGQLGLVMLVGSSGSLVGLPLAGRIIGRFGPAGTVRLAMVVALGGLVTASVLAVTTRSAALTAGGLFVTLFGVGIWDVAMNVEAAAVEHALRRTIMPRIHAGYSLGTVAAAVIASGMSAWRIPLTWHFGVTAAIIAVAGWSATARFLPTRAAHPPGSLVAAARREPVRTAWLERRTLLIGVFTLVAAFTEGTANDWLSVAFVDGFHLPPWAGVLGFAVFLTFMTVGRVLGTGLIDRFGRLRVLRVTLTLAALGSLLVVFGTTPLAYLGAAVWGFGVSLGFPVGMSAAADDPARAPARVSVVSTIAYGAFLVGPPALGFLGDHWGVLRALSVVSLLLLVAFATLPALRPLEGSRATAVAGQPPGPR